MTSASRAAERFNGAIASPMSFDQSCILGLRDQPDRVHEVGPGRTLRLQHLLPLRCEFVITATALAGLFNPSPLDQAACLQPIQQWIEGSNVVLQHSVGPLLDQLADLVAVASTVLNEGEDQQLSTALLQFPIDSSCGDMFHGDILR